MNETRGRSGFVTVLVVTFAAAALVTGGMFLMGVLSASSEQSPTPTPSQADEQGSGTPEMAITPELTLTPTQDTSQPSPTSEQEPVAAKGSGLGSLSVQTASGADAGQAQGTVIDLTTGTFAYLIVRPPSAADAVPVPWQLISQVMAGEAAVVLAVESGVLEAAPTLDFDQLPDLVTDLNWDSQIRAHWSGLVKLPDQPSAHGDESRVIAVTGEGLTGIHVITAEGTQIGQARDYTIDLLSGAPSYLLVELNAGRTSSGGVVLIPWERIAEVISDPQAIFVTASVEAVNAAPRVDMELWPNLILDPAWDRMIRDYWFDPAY